MDLCPGGKIACATTAPEGDPPISELLAKELQLRDRDMVSGISLIQEPE